MHSNLSRRQFLAAAGTASLLSTMPLTRSLAETTPPAPSTAKAPRVCIFSKHLQHLDYAELALQCQALKIDVDLTVREGGHVEPDRVKDDLPKAVETLRNRGVEVPMITTRLMKAEDPFAAEILESAAKLGIRYFRIGGHKYDKMGNPLMRLESVAKDLTGLAELAQTHGMFAGYHNHSGELNVGGPVWDLLMVFREIGNAHMGSNFDIGHATVEGAYGDWQITARALLSHIHMVAVKDFEWRGDRPRWVPLGEGLVNIPGFFEVLHSVNFTGPISMHFEYSTRSNEELINHIDAAAQHVRTALAEVGYAL